MRRSARAVLLLSAAFAWWPAPLSAHDVPDRVRINIFLKPESGRMLILARVPANALIDFMFPTVPDGIWLDLKQAEAVARHSTPASPTTSPVPVGRPSAKPSMALANSASPQAPTAA